MYKTFIGVYVPMGKGPPGVYVGAGLVNEAVGTGLLVLASVSVAGIIKVTVGEAYVGVGARLLPQAFNSNVATIRLRTAKGRFFVFIDSTNK
jgi:hypothetical protein